MSMSRLKTFHDFEEEKAKRYNMMVEKQLQQGSTFFKEQDAYQNRKRMEMQATNLMLQQQLNMKELQRSIRQEESMKENNQVMENRRRQQEMEMRQREHNKEVQQGLRQDILNQMEGERVRRHHKSIANLGNKLRHNPITNPI
jgi:hypothetical protein